MRESVTMPDGNKVWRAIGDRLAVCLPGRANDLNSPAALTGGFVLGGSLPRLLCSVV